METQTVADHPPQDPVLAVVRVSGRVSRPVGRTTRTSKPLPPCNPPAPISHPDININLLRDKLRLTCRKYMAPALLHEALADGLYSRAERWITTASQKASKLGKRKQYYVLETRNFTLHGKASAWEARTASGGSQPIDAGNGVTLFVKERREWNAFLAGYKRQEKRAGVLTKLRQKETEREWREAWKRSCGMEGVGGKRDMNAGPMWVLVKSVMGKIKQGEA